MVLLYAYVGALSIDEYAKKEVCNLWNLCAFMGAMMGRKEVPWAGIVDADAADPEPSEEPKKPGLLARLFGR